jgi:1-acyl-sn-glycerol-3-phosphate acyltransferase
LKAFLSITYYLYFFITGIPLLGCAILIWILTYPFDKRKYVLHWFTQFWGSFLFTSVPTWRVEVVGKDKIDNKKPKVFVSNHQSEFDIIVTSKLYAHFKWVSKAEVFKFPIIGWNMWMNQYIKLKRGDRKSIIQMMKDCCKALKNGSSVFIFPEGTRSKDGKVKKMASGAFVIAQREKVAIQPVVICGTKDIMHKGSWKLNFQAKVKIEVLDEIPYDEHKDMDTSELSNVVRDRIVSVINNYQK